MLDGMCVCVRERDRDRWVKRREALVYFLFWIHFLFGCSHYNGIKISGGIKRKLYS